VFARFTEPARQVIVHAQDEARELGHGEIAGEHVLLGLLRDRDGLAARALAAQVVELEPTRELLLAERGRGEQTTAGQIQFVRAAHVTLEAALRIADEMEHGMIGTEHLLLGLLDAGDDRVETLLAGAGTSSSDVREKLLALLSGSV
jgi:ATP-dependent Clp protease ATP-binding subunit ClpC